MEIVYTADGHATQHISARLPYQTEMLEDVVHMYSPVAYWESQVMPVFVPEVGTEGEIRALPLNPQPTQEDAL
jgi:hypothetical protein